MPRFAIAPWYSWYHAIVCFVSNMVLRCACSLTKRAWSVTSMLVIPWFTLDCQRSSCDADLNGVVCVMTFPSGSNCVGGRCGNWMLVLLWWCVIACPNGVEPTADRTFICKLLFMGKCYAWHCDCTMIFVVSCFCVLCFQFVLALRLLCDEACLIRY